MPAPKGHKKWGGRAKGSPNKITASVREVFASTFDMLQKDKGANLATWAKANPTDFYKLSSKLIPLEMAVQGGLTLTVVTGVPQQEDDPDSDGP